MEISFLLPEVELSPIKLEIMPQHRTVVSMRYLGFIDIKTGICMYLPSFQSVDQPIKHATQATKPLRSQKMARHPPLSGGPDQRIRRDNAGLRNGLPEYLPTLLVALSPDRETYMVARLLLLVHGTNFKSLTHRFPESYPSSSLVVILDRLDDISVIFDDYGTIDLVSSGVEQHCWKGGKEFEINDRPTARYLEQVSWRTFRISIMSHMPVCLCDR